jgi:hypothetical protein
MTLRRRIIAPFIAAIVAFGISAVAAEPASAAACSGDIYKESGYYNGKTYSLWYDTSWTADNDPSDEEYVFYFYPDWAAPRESMRIDTAAWEIGTIIDWRWSGHMYSPQSCATPVTLVADKLAVDLTGGPIYWKNNLWLWHK